MDGMKSYSIDSDVRIHAVFAIAILSVALAVILYVPTNQIINDLIVWMPLLAPLQQFGVLNVLEPAFFFWVLWSLFDKVVWRCLPLRQWHHIPVIRGKWEGSLKSSYSTDDDGNLLEMPLTMDVNQTFSKISIRCTFPGSSESYADVIGITECDSSRKACTLKFIYENSAMDESIAFDPNRDSKHFGLNILRIIEENASGRYYTCRNEPTHGFIEMKRKQ